MLAGRLVVADLHRSTAALFLDWVLMFGKQLPYLQTNAMLTVLCS